MELSRDERRGRHERDLRETAPMGSYPFQLGHDECLQLSARDAMGCRQLHIPVGTLKTKSKMLHLFPGDLNVDSLNADPRLLYQSGHR